MSIPNPLDGIPIPYRLRRTEMQQGPEGDWYVNMTTDERIVGIDFPQQVQQQGAVHIRYPSDGGPPIAMAGGSGGSGSVQRKPVVWILTNEILTEVMGRPGG